MNRVKKYKKDHFFWQTCPETERQHAKFMECTQLINEKKTWNVGSVDTLSHNEREHSVLPSMCGVYSGMLQQRSHLFQWSLTSCHVTEVLFLMSTRLYKRQWHWHGNGFHLGPGTAVYSHDLQAGSLTGLMYINEHGINLKPWQSLINVKGETTKIDSQKKFCDTMNKHL